MRFVAKTFAEKFGLNNERGVTAIEYALMAALVALAIISAVTLVGTNLGGTFNNVANSVSR